MVEGQHVTHEDVPNKRRRERTFVGVIAVLVLFLACALIAIALQQIELNGIKKSSHNKGKDEFDNKGAVVSDHDVCSQIGRYVLSFFLL